MKMRQHGPRNALGPEFRKLWAAAALANLNDGITLVAAPLLAAALTRDPALVAGLGFAQRLPWLLFTLLSGALVDRIDRRRAMAIVAAGQAMLFAVLGIATLAGWITIPLLYAVFFLFSSGDTLFDTASATVLPAIVPREHLPTANARLAGTKSVANHFIGPPLGGILFATALALPFLLGAGGLLIAAALIVALRGAFRVARAESAPPASLRREIVAGLRWLWRHRLLRTISLSLALLNLTLTAQVAVMVLFTEERLGLGPEGYGILLTAQAVGGVLASLIAPRIIAWLGPGKTLRLAMGFEAAIPAAIALAHSPFFVGAALALFGCHATVWGVLLVSLRQELIPDALRGRVEGVNRLLESGAAAPGALLGGLLAARFGLTAPFWLGAIVGVLLIPLVWSTFSDATVACARTEAGGEMQPAASG